MNDSRCAEWVLTASGFVALLAGMGGVYLGSWLAQLGRRR